MSTGATITVHELLNHTSGLFDYWQDEAFFAALLEDPSRQFTPTQLIAFANAHPASAQGAFSYANTNFIVLGLIIEHVTGHSLGAELSERVFDRLELRATSFDNSPEVSGDRIHGYGLVGDPALVDLSGVNPSAAWAAGGGIISTASDVATFYAGVVDGRLLPAKESASMLTTVAAGEGRRYGLGIAEVEMACGSAWGHQGEFPGYVTFAATSLDGTRQVVVMVNNYSLSEHAREEFLALASLAYCS